MAKVSMFTLCDSIENVHTPGGVVTHLVAPRTVLRPEFVPSNFSFGVSIGVRDLDFSVPNKVKFIISSPSGKILQESSDINIEIPHVEDTLPTEHQGFSINIDVRNLSVPEEGVYSFVLIVNDNPLETQEIPIFKGQKYD